LQSIYLWQLEVEQDEPGRFVKPAVVVVAAAKQVVERFLAVVRDTDPIGQVIGAKGVDGQLLVRFVVFHEQYFDLI
jgi:hypothetical protein